MHINNIIYYTEKRISRNKVSMVICMLLLCIAFYFIEFSVYITDTIGNEERIIKNALKNDSGMYGGICIKDDLSEDALQSFLGEIKNTGVVKAVGSQSGCAFYKDLKCVDSDVNYWEYIKNIQKNNPLPILSDEEYCGVMCYTVNRDEFGFYDFKLLRGKTPEENNDEVSLIYLGENFADVPVGTMFEFGIYKFIVAGIISSGSYILDESLVFNDTYIGNDSGVALSLSWNLDNLVLILDDQVSSFWSAQGMFMCEDGYSYDDVVSAIYDVSRKKGYEVSTQDFKERMNIVFKNSRKLQKSYAEIGWLIVISTVVTIMSSNILRMLIRKKELAVWKMNGFSHKDMLLILFFENLFVTIMSAFAAAVIFYYAFIDKLDKLTMKETMNGFLVGIFLCIGIGLVIAVMVTIIAVNMSVKKNIFEDLRTER